MTSDTYMYKESNKSVLDSLLQACNDYLNPPVLSIRERGVHVLQKISDLKIFEKTVKA